MPGKRCINHPRRGDWERPHKTTTGISIAAFLVLTQPDSDHLGMAIPSCNAPYLNTSAVSRESRPSNLKAKLLTSPTIQNTVVNLRLVPPSADRCWCVQKAHRNRIMPAAASLRTARRECNKQLNASIAATKGCGRPSEAADWVSSLPLIAEGKNVLYKWHCVAPPTHPPTRPCCGWSHAPLTTSPS